MSIGFQALFAVLPILFAGILLIGLRISAKKAMPLVYISTVAIAFVVWEVSFNRGATCKFNPHQVANFSL